MVAALTVPTARRVPLWWRDAAGSLAWASGLVVVGLWVAGGGVSGWGLTSLGRLTGLLAADLLLIQVLLMARIPAVERAYGQDVLARRHRVVGFTSVTLMLAHVVLITLGYGGLLGEFWHLVVTYPGMLLALAGTLLLAMVAVTSVRLARRRMRYESWHLLHLYAYLGAGLALPHQLWTGQEFLTSPVATAYWWSLWIAAAGAVLLWRVAVPVARTLAHGIRVAAVVREGPDTVSVWMRGRNLDRLRAGAGQFFTWRFLSGAGWTRGHPYSLSAAPTGSTLRITVRDGGGLAQLRPGTRVAIEGPYGRLHGGVRTRPGVTLLASGIGVTPLRALLEELPGPVTLIYRAGERADLVLTAEIDAIAAARGARVFYLVGHRVPGRPSWLPDSAAHRSDVEALRQLVPDVADHDVYVCGAPGWMEAVRRAALGAGVPAGRIHLERFDW